MLELQGNKLILEKLPIYDRIGTVKVVLAIGFVGEASEAQLSSIPSGHLKSRSRSNDPNRLHNAMPIQQPKS